ncbi:MAG: hypothetical protein II880_04815 [Schwartzia sp.]|nr:hypothetical protein [Schwartzia sp. (in: firmicutes)]
MNEKAEKFAKMIGELPDDNVFEMREVEDGGDHVTLFQSSLEVKKDFYVPLGVFIDDSIYTVIRVAVMLDAVNDENRARVRDLLADMNRQYKFKHYENDDGDILVDASIPSDAEHFDPETVAMVIDMLWDHLKKQYESIEKVVNG